jgi:hypothetical protein
MKIAAVVEEGFSASGTFINITISEMGKSIEEIGRIVSECDKFTVHNNVFGTNKIAFCTAEANPQNIAVSSHIVEFCSLIPSAPTEEMLLFLCKEMTRVWEEDEITQSQLLTDIRYIINQAIKKVYLPLPVYRMHRKLSLIPVILKVC